MAVQFSRETAMQTIPEIGFVRLPQILAMVPISRSSWWAGVKAGRFPQSVKLSPRVTVWRAEDIRALLEKLGQPSQPAT